MVSSDLSDALGNPTRVLAELYEADPGDNFPGRVATHFSNVFSDERTFLQIPTLDIRHPPASHADRALVRFRAMVQDTSASPEMYLSKLKAGGPGGWGIEIAPADQDAGSIDYDVIRECTTMWAVTIPGESSWCAEELDGPDAQRLDHSATPPSISPHRANKFPLVDTPHVGVQVKLYGTSSTESLKSTDLATFIGILTHEPLISDLENETAVELPTLHVLFTRPVPPTLVRRPSASSEDPASEDIREELISWVAEEALGGDKDAAEWVLLSSIAKVQSRNPPILPPSILLSQFPQPFHSTTVALPPSTVTQPPTAAPAPTPASEPLPTLSYVLDSLLPLHVTLPLTLDTLNTRAFAPASADEDLRAGALQLPAGTAVLLSEAGLQEGTLREAGVRNLQTVQEAMGAQTLQYAFPFSAFAFPTDLSFLVLAQGRASAFFKTDVSVRMRAREGADLYKPRDAVRFPPADKLARFRDLVIGARTAKVLVGDATSEYIQHDFVRERQQSKVTMEDLIHRMTVAKLMALSMHEKELTIELWERTKKMDARRKELLDS